MRLSGRNRQTQRRGRKRPFCMSRKLKFTGFGSGQGTAPRQTDQRQEDEAFPVQAIPPKSLSCVNSSRSEKPIASAFWPLKILSQNS